jgi:formate dehydrogenase assembly factor FdhD
MMNLHANKINPLKLLQMLPGDIIAQDLSLFLSRAVHESEQHAKSISLAKNMSKNERLQVEYELNCVTKERRATLQQNHRCGVCGKRILPQSAKAIYPDNSIFHLSCVRSDMNVHPITRRDFRVEPVDRLCYQTVRQDGQQRVMVRPK